MRKPIVEVKDVHKRFRLGVYDIYALRGVNLQVFPEEFLAISGSSGSGKTTLLNLLGCIDAPTSGEVYFDDVDVHSLDDKTLAKLRSDKIGYIFQTFNLIPVLTAIENVEYPLLLQKRPSNERRKRCLEALERVGLGKFGDHRPDQLSGGQRQRVAIARALVKKPRLILADEPTANLDSKTAREVLTLMEKLNTEDKITFIFSSHDPAILQLAHRIVKLTDGLQVN